ncbi:hypothetical protein ABKV19_000325, partial [Rosa sericea]
MEEDKMESSEELLFIDLATIRKATNDFSDSNKLGQGRLVLCTRIRVQAILGLPLFCKDTSKHISKIVDVLVHCFKLG